jgi:hypothetical protein
MQSPPKTNYILHVTREKNSYGITDNPE